MTTYRMTITLGEKERNTFINLLEREAELMRQQIELGNRCPFWAREGYIQEILKELRGMSEGDQNIQLHDGPYMTVYDMMRGLADKNPGRHASRTSLDVTISCSLEEFKLLYQTIINCDRELMSWNSWTEKRAFHKKS